MLVSDHFERDDISASPDIQIIRPVLHHSPAFAEIFGAIVRGANLVPLLVRKLPLDYVRAEAHFISAVEATALKP